MNTLNKALLATTALSLFGCGATTPPAATHPGDAAPASDAGKPTVQTYTSSSTGAVDIQVNSHLVLGKTSAVLVDGQLLAADATAVVNMITQSGHTLTTVLLTHAHPDHYSGFAVIQAAFPAAQFVTTSDVLGDFQGSAQSVFAYLQSTYGSLIASKLVTPTALTGNTIALDDLTLQVIALPNPGESVHGAALALPGGALVSGDLLYDDVHLYLGECHSAGWKQNLDAIGAMGFTTFYPGHGPSPVGASVFGVDTSYIAGAVPILEAAEALDASAGDGGDPRVGVAMGQIAQAFPSFHSNYLLGYSTTTFIDTNKCP